MLYCVGPILRVACYQLNITVNTPHVFKGNTIRGSQHVEAVVSTEPYLNFQKITKSASFQLSCFQRAPDSARLVPLMRSASRRVQRASVNTLARHCPAVTVSIHML